MRRPLATAAVSAALLLLSGCDFIGLEGASAIAARKEAEGKAIGAACRNAARAIEDCYTLNKKADKAAVYAGWREMDDYMRENKLEPVKPEIPVEPPKPKGEAKAAHDAEDEEDTGKADKGATRQARASTKSAEH